MDPDNSARRDRGVGERIAIRVLSSAAVLLLRVWKNTWRADVAEVAKLDAARAAGGPVIGVFWHGNYLPLFALLAGQPALVATSESFRGAVIAEICRRFGYRAVHVAGHDGSGREALRSELAGPEGLVAIAADGPLGPRHVAKAGLIALASESGARIVPIAAVAERRLVLSRRWDRMELPLPASRVTLRVGDSMAVSAAAGPDMSDAVSRVSGAIDALNPDAPGDQRRT